MKDKQPSIDGFVPRRVGSQIGELHDTKRKVTATAPIDRTLHSGSNVQEVVGTTTKRQAIGRSDIDESLREIDETSESPKNPSRHQRRKLAGRTKPRSRIKRFIKWFFVLLLIAGIGVGGWLAYKTFIASNSIFQGSIFDIAKSQPLKQDSNGRSNFLILGTSEDDPGHGGAFLTDSMMVMSIDQNNKNVFMFSIPRDLYVKYNMACNSGYAGKINEFFNCVNDNYDSAEAEQERMTETRKFVGDIFGIDIQYGVHVNNTVIKEAVDAVGGVDVDIQGSGDAPGILDRNFDWRCNYKCYLVKYDNGIHHLDGEHALFLAMARGDIAPTYGLANSNFDREKNQQKIIIALKDKAVSTGTFTNLSAVTSLIDALGKNLRTNIATSEIQTLMRLGTSIKTEDIKTISLFDDETRVVKTGTLDNGASVVMPAAGLYNYKDIQALIARYYSANPVIRENAGIVVLNGSGVVGAGQTQADILKDQDFNVIDIANAPAGTYAGVEIYVVDASKSGTLAKLQDQYKDAVVKTTTPPVTADAGTAFVIVIGTMQQ